jgi:hypothetical protein
MHFGYVDFVEYALKEALLKNIIGTQSHHGFIGIDETHIEMKVF